MANPVRAGETLRHILAADIGGTSSRFGHFTSNQSGELTLVQSLWLETHSAPTFPELLESLWAQGFSLKAEDADAAVFAVPGATNEDRIVFANISWDIDIPEVARRFPFKKLRFINDFLAQAYGCRSSLIADAEEVLPGRLDPSKVQAVVGAGTGLGTAALIPLPDGGMTVLASEGGHTAISFITDDEFEYFKFLVREVDAREFGGVAPRYVWGDIVVTGRGLSLVHKFLTGEDLTPAEVSKRAGPDSETMAWFARFYGRSVRNFTLDTLATGGVFISGGVAAKNPILVRHPEFAREFTASPKHGHLLEKIPVYLNKRQESGLYGSALFGHVLLGSHIS